MLNAAVTLAATPLVASATVRGVASIDVHQLIGGAQGTGHIFGHAALVQTFGGAAFGAGTTAFSLLSTGAVAGNAFGIGVASGSVQHVPASALAISGDLAGMGAASGTVAFSDAVSGGAIASAIVAGNLAGLATIAGDLAGIGALSPATLDLVQPFSGSLAGAGISAGDVTAGGGGSVEQGLVFRDFVDSQTSGSVNLDIGPDFTGRVVLVMMNRVSTGGLSNFCTVDGVSAVPVAQVFYSAVAAEVWAAVTPASGVVNIAFKKPNQRQTTLVYTVGTSKDAATLAADAEVITLANQPSGTVSMPYATSGELLTAVAVQNGAEITLTGVDTIDYDADVNSNEWFATGHSNSASPGTVTGNPNRTQNVSMVAVLDL